MDFWTEADPNEECAEVVSLKVTGIMIGVLYSLLTYLVLKVLAVFLRPDYSQLEGGSSAISILSNRS